MKMKMKIVEGKGCFSSRFNVDTTTGCSGGCTYCYGKYINRRMVKVKECDTKSLDRQWKKINTKHNIIRIGKFTDPGFEINEAQKLIDWMYCNKIKPVYVTKIPHDYISYKKITELGGVVHITIGYDKLEPGCIPNLTRLKFGEKYKDYNVVYRLVREVTSSADKWTRNFIRENKERILLTPLRLKGKQQIFNLGGNINKYDFHKGFYRPWDIHDDYKGLATCLDGSRNHYCGKCLLN